jgi:hypothetical protein
VKSNIMEEEREHDERASEQARDDQYTWWSLTSISCSWRSPLYFGRQCPSCPQPTPSSSRRGSRCLGRLRSSPHDPEGSWWTSYLVRSSWSTHSRR